MKLIPVKALKFEGNHERAYLICDTSWNGADVLRCKKRAINHGFRNVAIVDAEIREVSHKKRRRAGA